MSVDCCRLFVLALGAVFSACSSLEHPPGGTDWVDVQLTCALDREGEIECWSPRRDREKYFPDGRFRAFAYPGCGITFDNELLCNYWVAADPPPAGRYQSLTLGNPLCALDLGGEVECWRGRGDDNYRPPPSGVFLSVSSGSAIPSGIDGACGIREDGTLACWGGYWADQAGEAGFVVPVEGRFTSIELRRGVPCGVRDDGVAICWDHQAIDEMLPPARLFRQVIVGLKASCGIELDGHMSCWGYRISDWESDEEFVDFDVVDFYACGITAGGELVCQYLTSPR